MIKIAFQFSLAFLINCRGVKTKIALKPWVTMSDFQLKPKTYEVLSVQQINFQIVLGD